MHEEFLCRLEAGALQHGRPKEGMEVYDVLTDEVVEFIFIAVTGGSMLPGPEAIEVKPLSIAVVLGGGDVANRGVEPHVKILVRLAGNLKTKVRTVPGNVPILQAGIKPLLQFVRHRELRIPLPDQHLEPFLVVRQLEEVVL